ncbi:uncharacterized protein LOC144569805 [Carex rostrata]
MERNSTKERRLTMDTLFTKLEGASQAGDVNSLKELLKKDKHLLEKVIGITLVRDNVNPLHIAATFGHADFVREVIYRKSELAKELNGQGLSPLHLAAAHGHVTVVKELLKADLDLCLIREKQEGLLPLHIAVKKRRTIIIKELVEACEEAVHVLTNGGETILHLAVKYNLFDTVEFLIDRVHNLNAKDDKGNTILHHAVASKQLSVIKFLLSKAAIDVNTMNLKFLTPLDVLLESRQQRGDLVLDEMIRTADEMIRAAGGKTAAEVLSESEPVVRDSNLSDSSNPIVRQPGTINDIEQGTVELPKVKKKTKYDPQILLLVSTLVATLTFTAAILNPPGGFRSDGKPLLADSLISFWNLTMLAFFSSVSVMMLFLCVVPRKKKVVRELLVLVIWLTAYLMLRAFLEGINVLYGNDNEHKELPRNMFKALNVLYTLGFSWMLGRFLIFLLKKSGFLEPVRQRFALRKRQCLLKWQQFSNGSNCFKWFKRIICVVSILLVLGLYAILLLVIIETVSS